MCTRAAASGFVLHACTQKHAPLQHDANVLPFAHTLLYENFGYVLHSLHEVGVRCVRALAGHCDSIRVLLGVREDMVHQP